jgi:ABC-type branched-subunit amino acid transport system substrate-binding protein
MRRSRLPFIAGALALALMAAACGSAAEETSTTTAVTAAPSAAAAAGTATTTTAAAGEKFGDLASPCGKGDAKGATATGVTDTSISIGFGDDAGYAAAPGTSKDAADAIRALTAWCNDQGGINGRKIDAKYYDAKILDVKSAITQACADKVFMLVGDAWALDSLQEDVRIECKLPAIPTYSVSTAFAMGPAMIQGVPNPGDQIPGQFLYAIQKLFPDAVKKTAFTYADYAATLETAEKYKQASAQVGYTDLKCDQIYNIGGEADWKPFAENLKRCGAEVVFFSGTATPNLQNFLTAAKQVGFTPKAWVVDANTYTEAFQKWNGSSGGAGDNVYARFAFVPVEEASKNPATQQYLDAVKKTNGVTGLLGMQATSSFLLWATGVKACGSTVTAKCVFDELAKIKDWTAGGLHAPTEPAQNLVPDCGVLLKLTGGAFTRVAPTDKTFECDPKYRIASLKTKYLDDAGVGADRKATKFGTFTLS